MCLHRITNRARANRKNPIVAWKYMDLQLNKVTKYSTPCKGKKLLTGKWIRANRRKLKLDNYSNKSYLSGFHCYLSKESCDNSEWGWGSIIAKTVKVLLSGNLTFGYGDGLNRKVPQVVGEYIFIPEIDNQKVII